MLSPSGIYLCLVLLAAALDVLSRRIPNPVNFILMASGLISAFLGWIDISLLQSALGICVCLAALLIPFALNVYRGGDVKLCMAMSAWLGVEGGLWVIGLGVVGGGLLGAIMLVFMKGGRQKSVPMAVCFAAAGLWIEHFGVPSW